MVLVAILVIAALMLVNALYVAAEFAAVSVRRSRLHQLAADGNPFAAWLLPILESPAALDRYIAACQIGITISSLVLGAYAQATIAVWLAPYFAAVGGLQQSWPQSTSTVVVLLVLTMAQVVFAELVPKLVALQYPTQTSLYTLIPMMASRWIYRPFITWLNGSGMLILRMVGAPYQAHRHIHSPDEIELLIAESRDGGLLEPDEHRRLQRALRLNLRQATQLMVPRKRISALDSRHAAERGRSASSRKARTRGCRSIATRIDNIVGILRTKDLVRWFVEGRPGATLADLMRPIPSVHESVTADRILARPSRAALASGAGRRRIRRHGGAADAGRRADRAARPRRRRIQGRRSCRRDAGRRPHAAARVKWRVDDAATLLETTWETDATTVGGLVTEALGHLPAGGETVAVGDFEFEVERVGDRVPQSVAARRVVPVPSEDAQ